MKISCTKFAHLWSIAIKGKTVVFGNVSFYCFLRVVCLVIISPFQRQQIKWGISTIANIFDGKNDEMIYTVVLRLHKTCAMCHKPSKCRCHLFILVGSKAFLAWCPFYRQLHSKRARNRISNALSFNVRFGRNNMQRIVWGWGVCLSVYANLLHQIIIIMCSFVLIRNDAIFFRLVSKLTRWKLIHHSSNDPNIPWSCSNSSSQWPAMATFVRNLLTWLSCITFYCPFDEHSAHIKRYWNACIYLVTWPDLYFDYLCCRYIFADVSNVEFKTSFHHFKNRPESCCRNEVRKGRANVVWQIITKSLRIKNLYSHTLLLSVFARTLYENGTGENIRNGNISQFQVVIVFSANIFNKSTKVEKFPKINNIDTTNDDEKNGDEKKA